MAINSLWSLCQDGIRGWNYFAFMWIVFTFVWLFSFMWGQHSCCTGNGVSFYMCSAVEVAGLARIFDIAAHLCDCIDSGVQVSLVNNNDSSYLTIFTSLCWVWKGKSQQLNPQSNENQHARWTFMLAPYFFLGSAVSPHFLNSRIATAQGLAYLSAVRDFSVSWIP